MKLKVSLLIAMLCFTSVLYAQNAEPLNDQMRSLLKSEPFRVGLLIQTRGVFSLDDDGFNGGRKYDMGATRFDVQGNLDGNFIYRLQVDVRQQISLIDAQVGYRFNPNTRLVAGAFKPFTSLDLDPGPQNTDFMNRARNVGTMMNTREIGLTLIGKQGDFRYWIGMYNGTGLTRQNDDRFMYTTRFAYDFTVNDGASLQLGVNSFINQTRGVNVGNTGLTTAGDRVAFGLYADYDSDFLFGAFEILQTSFDAVQLGGDKETILGYYGTVGVKLDDKNEVLARWDQIEYDVLDRASGLVTLGWNHYPTKLIKVTVNALALFNQSGDNAAGLSAQLQFSF